MSLMYSRVINESGHVVSSCYGLSQSVEIVPLAWSMFMDVNSAVMSKDIIVSSSSILVSLMMLRNSWDEWVERVVLSTSTSDRRKNLVQQKAEAQRRLYGQGRIYPPDDKQLLEKYETLICVAFQTFLAGRAASLQKELSNPLNHMKFVLLLRMSALRTQTRFQPLVTVCVEFAHSSPGCVGFLRVLSFLLQSKE
eukprot:g39997.t1